MAIEYKGYADETVEWDLTEALDFIRKLQARLQRSGYLVALGLTGGVLNRGASFSDLDIIVYPLKTQEATFAPGDLLYFLGQPKVFTKHKFVTHYHEGDDKLVAVCQLNEPRKRRVDFFFFDFPQ